MGVRGEGLELHLGQALADPDDGLELPDGDGDGEPLLPLLLNLAIGVPHEDVLVLQLLGSVLLETRAAARPEKKLIVRAQLRLK